jgi:SAM-dependent methyltransferase
MVGAAMSGIQTYVEQWERNASTDPLWAILTDASKSKNRWNEDEFFATGELEVSSILEIVDRRLGGVPRDTFLDFGCGVGRNSRALGKRFARGTGIDISARMVELARAFHRTEQSSVEFAQNRTPDLIGIPSRSVSFVYSHMVLQHAPAHLQRAYLRELLRILAPGGVAALQTAEMTLCSPRNVLRRSTPAPVKRVINHVLRRRNVEAVDAYEMHTLGANAVLAAAESQQCALVLDAYTNSTDAGHGGRVQFFDALTARWRIVRGESNSPYLGHFYFFRRS